MWLESGGNVGEGIVGKTRSNSPPPFESDGSYENEMTRKAH